MVRLPRAVQFGGVAEDLKEVLQGFVALGQVVELPVFETLGHGPERLPQVGEVRFGQILDDHALRKAFHEGAFLLQAHHPLALGNRHLPQSFQRHRMSGLEAVEFTAQLPCQIPVLPLQRGPQVGQQQLQILRMLLLKLLKKMNGPIRRLNMMS